MSFKCCFCQRFCEFAAICRAPSIRCLHLIISFYWPVLDLQAFFVTTLPRRSTSLLTLRLVFCGYHWICQLRACELSFFKLGTVIYPLAQFCTGLPLLHPYLYYAVKGVVHILHEIFFSTSCIKQSSVIWTGVFDESKGSLLFILRL